MLWFIRTSNTPGRRSRSGCRGVRLRIQTADTAQQSRGNLRGRRERRQGEWGEEVIHQLDKRVWCQHISCQQRTSGSRMSGQHVTRIRRSPEHKSNTASQTAELWESYRLKNTPQNSHCRGKHCPAHACERFHKWQDQTKQNKACISSMLSVLQDVMDACLLLGFFVFRSLCDPVLTTCLLAELICIPLCKASNSEVHKTLKLRRFNKEKLKFQIKGGSCYTAHLSSRGSSHYCW